MSAAGPNLARTRNEDGFGRSAAVMATGTLLSRVTGAIRTIALLGFGVTALADTYTAANNTPNMIYELVAGGVLSAVLVPIFVGLFRRDDERSHDGVNAIVSLVAVVLLGAVAIVVVAAPAIVWVLLSEPGDGLKRSVAAQLLRMFAPQIGVYGFITVASAMLNARRRFAAPMFAPVLNNVVVIVVLLWARRIVHALVPHPGRSTTATLQAVAFDGPAKLLLGLGTTAGVVVMGLAILPSLRGLGVRLHWHWEPRHPAVIELIRLSGWTVGYVVANMVALTFITNTANRVDGDYTAYSSAYATFFLLPHGVFAVSIMTALQPSLAEAFLDRRRGRFRIRLSSGIRSILALMVPAAVGYVILSRPIVGLIRNGALSAGGANRVADVLRAFAVGLPAFSVYLVLVNAFQAMRDTRATFEINIIENAINIVVAAVLYRMGMGVEGLALSFSVAYLVSALLAFRRVSRRTGGLKERELLSALGRIALASAAMAGATKLAAIGACRLFVGTGATLRLPGRLGLVVEVGTAVTCGVTVYAVVGRLVGVTEFASVLAGLRRRIGIGR